jgi:hypothetical protein
VAFLNKRLASIVDQKARVARLIADLDADEFTVREKASTELARIGTAAEGALRKAAANPSSAEVRRRANALLTKLKDDETSPETLVAVRTVEVLEHVATPEARQLLRKLASGPPEARLTHEAKAASDRRPRSCSAPGRYR